MCCISSQLPSLPLTLKNTTIVVILDNSKKIKKLMSNANYIAGIKYWYYVPCTDIRWLSELLHGIVQVWSNLGMAQKNKLFCKPDIFFCILFQVPTNKLYFFINSLYTELENTSQNYLQWFLLCFSLTSLFWIFWIFASFFRKTL